MVAVNFHTVFKISVLGNLITFQTILTRRKSDNRTVN